MSNSNHENLSTHPLYPNRTIKELLEIDRLSVQDRCLFRYTVAELIHLSVQNRIARDQAYAFIRDQGLDLESRDWAIKK